MSAEAMSSIAAPGGVFAFEFRMEQDTSRAPVPTSATLPRHLPTSCSALKQSWRMKLAVPTPPKPTASRNRRAYFSVCNHFVCGYVETRKPSGKSGTSSKTVAKAEAGTALVTALVADALVTAFCFLRKRLHASPAQATRLSTVESEYCVRQGKLRSS